MSTSSAYVEGIHAQFGYLGSWLPNSPLELGDVGFEEDGEFERVTSLANLGVAFGTRKGADPLDLSFTSKSDVAVKFKAAGEVSPGTTLPAAKAGVLMEFGSDGAFVFQAMGCTVYEIDDRAAVARAAAALLKEQKWDRNWSIVHTIVRAQSATIVVSRSRNAKLELSANAPVTVAQLAKAELGLQMEGQSGELLQILAAPNLSPLFKLGRLRASTMLQRLGLGGAPGLRTFRSDDDNAPAPAPAPVIAVDAVLATLGEEDLLEEVGPS